MYILTSLWAPSFLSYYNLCTRYFEQPEIDLEKDFLLKSYSSSNLFNSLNLQKNIIRISC